MGRAIALLPQQIRPFFEASRVAIVEHVVDPDLWRTAGWDEEGTKHFVDMDAYGPHPFTALPHDLDEAIGKHGKAFVEQNGTLPWPLRPILELRVSDSITAVASIIAAAWVEAGRPALPLQARRRPRKVRRQQPGLSAG